MQPQTMLFFLRRQTSRVKKSKFKRVEFTISITLLIKLGLKIYLMKSSSSPPGSDEIYSIHKFLTTISTARPVLDFNTTNEAIVSVINFKSLVSKRQGGSDDVCDAGS